MEKATNQKLFPGGYYHVYNRGNNHEKIFIEAENYTYFLSLWIKHIEPVAQTFCYCLLPNHFHFFIRVREDKEFVKEASNLGKTMAESTNIISRAFSNLFNAYAKAFNKKYNRTGSLFQKQFKRKEIQDDANYTAIIAYILNNAVKHGICSSAEDYPYSAYQIIISDRPTRLLRNEIINWFGDKEAFIEFIKIYGKHYSTTVASRLNQT